MAVEQTEKNNLIFDQSWQKGVSGVTRAGLVVNVPLLDAGQAVGVGAGQDDVGLSLEADAALVQRVGVDVARQLSMLFRIKHEVLSRV